MQVIGFPMLKLYRAYRRTIFVGGGGFWSKSSGGGCDLLGGGGKKEKGVKNIFVFIYKGDVFVVC